MSSLKEFQCEICGIVTDRPTVHWFVIECGDQKLALIKWDAADRRQSHGAPFLR